VIARRFLRAAFGPVALAFGAGPASAQADLALDRLARAEALLSSALESSERVTALGAAIRAYEDATAAVRAQISQVGAQERDLSRSLAQAEDQMARLLAALARLGQVAEPMLLASAAPPDDVVRASILLRGAADKVAERSASLLRDRDALRVLREEQAALLARLDEGWAGLDAARLALVDTLPQGSGLVPDISEDAANLAALSIALDAVAPVEADPEKMPPMVAPLRGRVSRAFGAPDSAGIARPGIAVDAVAGAMVVSPADATVRYVGQLDSLGAVIILEPARDILVVLAGIGTPLVRAGSQVARAAPLAFLPGAEGAHEVFSRDIGVAGGNAQDKTLYMEIRQAGQPVDPALWLTFDM